MHRDQRTRKLQTEIGRLLGNAYTSMQTDRRPLLGQFPNVRLRMQNGFERLSNAVLGNAHPFRSAIAQCVQ
jgi:hypothetical protein